MLRIRDKIRDCDCCGKSIESRQFRMNCITCGARMVIQASPTGRWWQERVLADLCARTGFDRQEILDEVKAMREKANADQA